MAFLKNFVMLSPNGLKQMEEDQYAEASDWHDIDPAPGSISADAVHSNLQHIDVLLRMKRTRDDISVDPVMLGF